MREQGRAVPQYRVILPKGLYNLSWSLPLQLAFFTEYEPQKEPVDEDIRRYIASVGPW